MGSIYKSKNNNGTITYYGSIYVNGKRIRKRLANSRPSALQELKKWEYELLFKESAPITETKRLISVTRTSFLRETELLHLSDKTMQTIMYSTRFFMEYCESIGIKYINDITVEIAKNFISKRARKKISNSYKANQDGFIRPISASTLNKQIQYLKRFFEYCIDMNWLYNNPFKKVKYFKVAHQQRYYFTTSDIKMIFKQPSKFNDFYTFLLNTGLRPTDAYKLGKKHINGSYLVLKMNKTGDHINIPLNKKIIKLLRARFNDEYIFPEIQSDRQKRNCVRNIQGLFKPSFVRDNNINLHTFRHTYAHTMLNRGVPKEVLQTLLGHRSIKTTEIYANWVDIKELEKYI